MTDFEIRSSLAVRHPADVPLREQIEELAQSIRERSEWFARDVAAHRMTPEKRDHHERVWAAILSDHAGLDGAGQLSGADTPGISWMDRIAELRRELAIRRNAWPRRIGKPGGPTASEAARRFDCLDAVHWRYWIRLFAFTAPDIAPADDAARVVVIAERERDAAALRARRESHRSPGPPSATLLDQVEHRDEPADTKAASLRRAASLWSEIAHHATAIALQETGLSGASDRTETLSRLSTFALDRLLRACDRGDNVAALHRGTVDRWLLNQIAGERATAAAKTALQIETRKVAA